MTEVNPDEKINALELATELTIAWLGNPNVRVSAEDVPAFLKSVFATIGELTKASSAPATEAAPEFAPAVPVRSSIKPDYLISLITGQKLKSLKRHLSSHGLTPAQYRERYGLKADYPMVAPSYSQTRREVAQKLGLGRKLVEARRAAAAAAPAGANKLAKAARAGAKSKADGASSANGSRPGRPRKAPAPVA